MSDLRLFQLHFVCNFIIFLTSGISVNDPRLHPGHLQPLGVGNRKIPVEVATAFPSPMDFFTQYVEQQKPLLIRGGAKESRAFKVWNDAYMYSLPDVGNISVVVEMSKKENRSVKEKKMLFKDFLGIYKKQNIYLVDIVPESLRKDALLPSPLRCNETTKYLEDAGLWYSSGDTRSTLHSDGEDDIRCVIRGREEHLIVDYVTFSKKNGIQMKYFTNVDVDRVDLEKFPGLADLDFYSAVLEEGDCIYTPFRWFHQLRAYPDNDGQCITTNIWFNHLHNHRPVECDMPPQDATMDKYQYHYEDDRKNKIGRMKENNDEEEGEDEDREDEEESSQVSQTMGTIEFIVKFLRKRKQGQGLNTKQFLRLLKAHFIESSDKNSLETPPSFDKIGMHLVEQVDKNKDGVLALSELKDLLDQPTEEFRKVHHSFLRLKLYINDLIEFRAHGKTDEAFEDFRKDRIEERRLANNYLFKEEL